MSFNVSFACVDVIEGHLTYWFVLEGIEPNTGYCFDNIGCGVGVDEHHEITAIYSYSEDRRIDGSDTLVDFDSEVGIAVLHAIQNDQRPGWLDVDMIKTGTMFLYDVIVSSMGASVAESLFPGEEIDGIDLIATVVQEIDEIEAESTDTISSTKIH